MNFDPRHIYNLLRLDLWVIFLGKFLHRSHPGGKMTRYLRLLESYCYREAENSGYPDNKSLRLFVSFVGQLFFLRLYLI